MSSIITRERKGKIVRTCGRLERSGEKIEGFTGTWSGGRIVSDMSAWSETGCIHARTFLSETLPEPIPSREGGVSREIFTLRRANTKVV